MVRNDEVHINLDRHEMVKTYILSPSQDSAGISLDDDDSDGIWPGCGCGGRYSEILDIEKTICQ